MTGELANWNQVVRALQALSPFIVIWVSAGVFGFIISIAKFRGSVSEKFKSVNSLNDTIRRVDQSLSEIKWNISIIESRIQRTEDAYVQAHSPISLTQRWKDLAVDVWIEQSIINVWDSLKSLIEEQTKWKNPYDIQEFLLSMSLKDLGSMIDKEWLERLKTKAYNEWVPLAVLWRIVAIIVRDKYFQENSIDHKEVDECDPSKKES